jgi:hypothetical protein
MDMDSLRRPHPFIVQQLSDDGGSSFKLVCDGLACECGSTVVETFDFLFKFCWVFQLEYPLGLNQFFDFFQFKIYKLSYGRKKASPTVCEIGRLFGFK